MFHGPFHRRSLLSCLLVLWMVGSRVSVTGSTRTPLPSPSPMPSADTLRKELIKAQILQRLGLTHKPNLDLTHQISREVVLETLKRTQEVEAENESSLPGQFARSRHHEEGGQSGNDSQTSNNTQPNHQNHKYAKTSDILSFPDKGNVM